VNVKIRYQIERRKRRIERRLDKKDCRGCDRPAMTASNVRYEIADRTRATAQGGIGAMHLLAKRLGLPEAIDERLGLLKIHLPYHDSDHVLNIAYNLLAGGTCLEHIERLRVDEAYLDALGARRIPDPTTAGDFCRRFDTPNIFRLQQVFNDTRLAVWRQQPKKFFDEAIVEADGTMVETSGECKQGMDINHKGQWGYHPLVLSLANTGEPLFVVNRSGNRPSHEHAAFYFDQSIALCRRAGFRKIRLRGDTDFTQTAPLDRWDMQGVTFVFGIDAMPALYEIAGNLPPAAWKTLVRREKYSVKTQPRRRPENVKQQIVEQREFEDIRLVKEHVAEFRYRPAKCSKEYRVVVVWKELEVHKGQQKLFDDERCFFYITNDEEKPADAIVFDANDRCDQENLLQQLKSGVQSLSAPVDNLLSNWAYMVMASLAWSLKAWFALLLPEEPDDGKHPPGRRPPGGRASGSQARSSQRPRREEKRRLLRMDFSTFRHAMMTIPSQVLSTGRLIVCRLLAWNPWQAVFFRLLDQLRKPLDRLPRPSRC
jgi:hypothetical protein